MSALRAVEQPHCISKLAESIYVRPLADIDAVSQDEVRVREGARARGGEGSSHSVANGNVTADPEQRGRLARQCTWNNLGLGHS